MHKWAFYILKKSQKRSKIWPFIWLVCAILFLILYVIHHTTSILVGIVLFLAAALIWAERKAFSEILEEKEKTITALEKKLHDID